MASTTSIPGLGPVDVAPVVNPEFDAAHAELSPEDFFVLTRVDGKTSFKQIILICGFPEARAIAILQKLRREGAVLLPGEKPPPRRPAPPEARPPAAPPAPAAPAASAPAARAVPEIDERLLEEACDLTVEQKRAILVKQAQVEKGTLFDVLDVGPEADKKTLKRAYFKISKDFHPDRFYGKNLGSFKDRLAEIFKAATGAFELLEDDGRRAEYLARLNAAATPAAAAVAAVAAVAATARRGSEGSPVVDRAARARKAADLYERACQHEVTGELEAALREFAAAIQLDPQPRYLRRAAEACLKAQELRSAEEYARKATEIDPRDAGAHRTLAKVLRAGGRREDALRELEIALRFDPDNAHIAADLDDLRREIGKAPWP